MIDLSGYTKQAIEQAMLQQVSSGIDTREGSLIQTAAGLAAWFLEGVYYTDLSHLQQNTTAQTAVGDALDLLAAERGLVRRQATAAIRQGTFNVAIPTGSQFKTINGASSLIYTSGTEISGSGSTWIYQMTCTTPGEAGNSYTGPLLPITAISGLTTATLGDIITPGSDEETDDSLRQRYFLTFDTAAFGGNIAAYRNTILAIDGVGAVQVYPAYNGGGTVLCSILDSQLTPAEPGLVEQVQNIICPSEDGGSTPSPNGYGYAPIGAAVNITTGTELTLDITCDIQFAASVPNGVEVYQSQIEQAIQSYISSVNATWGQALVSQTISYPVVVYASRIVAAILTVPNVINVTNLLINGSAADVQCTETAQLQQVPTLGTVIINGE